MSYNSIRYAVADGIATITLHRPDKLNAFTVEMMNEMIDAFDKVDADDTVRAVIVTGEGRGFCAGADLSDGPSAFIAAEDTPVRPDGSLDYSRQSARDGGGLVTLRIFRCLKPVIACINGPAVGIGATMTLPMDIRLASEDARIGFVFARRGIVPEAASSFFLPRIVGISQALQWCYSGRVFSAREAKEGGLVSQVLPPDELLPAAIAIAREIADNTAPVSVALIRQMMWRGFGMTDPMDAHKVDSRGILSRGQSADVAEGVASFFEKRPAVFPDRVSTDMPDYFPWWEEPAYS
ncbi:enoyl-CoA hydratase [Sphingobium jiangsuense]|uniref:Enoyl-CoA hydratase/carnithine racemase n=1 Tax=Sphingobium jiangsuense TaxID=870476 RepID=A0A7W6BGT3_9SPHN|nr:crotonase/enoyl-CoA hydratase family protein [Sphingobium jiangsuense]MBB3925774.1 enoyl-CoA hydratase/carnithine racemase [Sphingobium jiangsuense]GLT02587.1 enoyl-CoA hydratase [Sphingobium jiangsuense]